jgi:hypothetical protein
MAEATEKYGIDKTLTGYTVESYTISEKPSREEVRDEKNKVKKELRYETRFDLQLTVRGATAPATTGITFDSKSWIVDDVSEAGSYNGLLRFNVTAHRYSGCETETPV